MHGFWTLVSAALIVWVVNLVSDLTPGPWQVTSRRRRLQDSVGDRCWPPPARWRPVCSGRRTLRQAISGQVFHLGGQVGGGERRSGAPRGQLNRTSSRPPLLRTAPNSGSDSSRITLAERERSCVALSSEAKSPTPGGPWSSVCATQYGIENFAEPVADLVEMRRLACDRMDRHAEPRRVDARIALARLLGGVDRRVRTETARMQLDPVPLPIA